MTHIQAEKLIQSNSNCKKGIYLIRFSSKNRGYFTITVVGRKKSNLHYRVYYSRETKEYLIGKKSFHSLDDIISIYHRELCLRLPCPGSKFREFQTLPSIGEEPIFVQMDWVRSVAQNQANLESSSNAIYAPDQTSVSPSNTENTKEEEE